MQKIKYDNELMPEKALRIICLNLKGWFTHFSPRGRNSEPTYFQTGICGIGLSG